MAGRMGLLEGGAHTGIRPEQAEAAEVVVSCSAAVGCEAS